MHSFLATVTKVYTKSSDFKKVERKKDYVSVYNSNTNYEESDARFLGVVEIKTNSSGDFNYVFPFDKNNVTYPIVGETVVVISIGDGRLFWLPYSSTEYPNYRQDYVTYQSSIERKQETSSNTEDKSTSYKKTSDTGITNTNSTSTNKSDHYKPIYEKIKFLEPNEGDTITGGRAGNTIRFTQNFNASNKDKPSPAILIRNRQSAELDDKKIGFLGKEDINLDGSSIYLTSNETKVAFDYNNVKKKPVAWKGFPNAKELSGDQIFINSDRIILSSKASEFIIFGKGNTGVITDGLYSIDAELGMNVSAAGTVVFKTEKNADIILDASSGGNILIGSDNIQKTKSTPSPSNPIQPMVGGASLVKLLEDLITAITQMQFATPSGPTPVGPLNVAQFQNIKATANQILSKRAWVNKD